MACSAAAMWCPYHAPERSRTAAPRRRDRASAAADAIAADNEAGAAEAASWGLGEWVRRDGPRQKDRVGSFASTVGYIGPYCRINYQAHGWAGT